MVVFTKILTQVRRGRRCHGRVENRSLLDANEIWILKMVEYFEGDLYLKVRSFSTYSMYCCASPVSAKF